MKSTIEGVLVESYDQRKHYIRYAPILVKYFKEVNNEDLEEEIPVLMDGKWIGVKKLDAKIYALSQAGVLVKVALVQDEIVGFLWYKPVLDGLISAIEAFYVIDRLREHKVGMALMNSLANEKNEGKFEIYATIHDNNSPKQMLSSWKGWERVRKVNDRDLFLMKGVWNINEIQVRKETDHDVIRSTKFGQA